MCLPTRPNQPFWVRRRLHSIARKCWPEMPPRLSLPASLLTVAVDFFPPTSMAPISHLRERQTHSLVFPEPATTSLGISTLILLTRITRALPPSRLCPPPASP